MAEGSRRLFLALWPGPGVLSVLDDLAARGQLLAGGRRMRADTLHMTLAFLGAVPETRIPALCEALVGCVTPPFVLSVDQLGYWPHNRILWAGCRQPPAALGELATTLREILEGQGFAPSRPDFFPHVTLLRDAREPDSLPMIEASNWPVREWVLMESCRDASGVRYRPLRAWPLGPDAA